MEANKCLIHSCSIFLTEPTYLWSVTRGFGCNERVIHRQIAVCREVGGGGGCVEDLIAFTIYNSSYQLPVLYIYL